MASCTFFGHRDCPSDIRDKLRETLIDLIENHGVDSFYIGSHGSFDAMARNILRELKTVYPEIEYTVVLAYMPQGAIEYMLTTRTPCCRRESSRFQSASPFPGGTTGCWIMLTMS